MSGASAMVRDGVRQAMAWLHGWTGLLLGYVLFVICLAGTLSVFKPEIGRWMRPEVTAQADSKSAIVAATGWLSMKKIWSIVPGRWVVMSILLTDTTSPRLR